MFLCRARKTGDRITGKIAFLGVGKVCGPDSQVSIGLIFAGKVSGKFSGSEKFSSHGIDSV